MEAVSEISNPVIYGMGNLTSALVKEMNCRNIRPLCIIDGYKESSSFEGIPVYNIEEVKGLDNKEITVIVTPVTGVNDIYKTLKSHSIYGKVIPIWKLLKDAEITDRLEYLNQ